MKNLIPIIILLFSVFQFFENKNVNAQSKKGLVFEKLYLHIDRELYSPGDDIWMKSYLVNGLNNQLIPGYKSIYAQLVSESGEVIQNRLFFSQEGSGKSDFTIPDSTKSGTYIIRAYTKYQQNFGEESYFHKKIFISGIGNSGTQQKDRSASTTSKIDASFLPEGGNFVANTVNRIAFKVIDKNGKGISSKGKVVDERGTKIVSFESRYRGMGEFKLKAESGKNYTVLLDNYPDYSYKFETAKENAIGLHYNKEDNNLLFTVSRNSELTEAQELIFQAEHKDIVVFKNQILLDQAEVIQPVLENFFPIGISKVSVRNKQNTILAERLVFVRDKNTKTLTISLNKEKYSLREKVELEISPQLRRRDSVSGTLSVAVVQPVYFNSGGNNQTIESYLLLDSELKGGIEAPASYFFDEEDISAEEKIDLLMQVNGWRKYYWDELEKYLEKELPDWEDLGLSLKGNVVSLNGKKPVAEGQVFLSPFVGGLQVKESTTDKDGNFLFEGLLLRDSAMVILDAKTKKGSKKTEINIEQVELFDTMVNPKTLECPFINPASSNFYDKEFTRLNTEKQYAIGAETIVLEDIQIEGQRKLNDGHFRLYGEPDISYQIKDVDQHFIDIFDYIEAKMPAGVLVTTDNSGNRTVRIRMGNKAPLLLIDGVQTDWEMIKAISMNDVDKIEILKTGFSTAIYGSRGGDGVISIFTKVGEKSYDFQRNIAGRATPYVRGYNQPRIFYSPLYQAENKTDPKPDFRPTLFWAPEVKVENGIGYLEFYTSDEETDYIVVVEGLSKNGKICYGTAQLSVSPE